MWNPWLKTFLCAVLFYGIPPKFWKKLFFETAVIRKDIGFRKGFVSWLANMELFTFIASLKLFGISYMQESPFRNYSMKNSCFEI